MPGIKHGGGFRWQVYFLFLFLFFAFKKFFGVSLAHTRTHTNTKDETRNFGCCCLFSLSIGSFGFLCPGSAKMKTLYRFRVDLPRIEQWLKKQKPFSMQTHIKQTHTHTQSSPRFLTLIVVVDVVMDFYGADLILHPTQTHTDKHPHTHIHHLKTQYWTA